MNYYNEHDPKAAAWLRELIKRKHIANGIVDERSISDVQPKDLDGYAQCHFFAGIGGWSLALRLAGWPDAEPVWTGSCPCQPFSSAGKRRGKKDPRHLWPQFRRLIAERAPAIVFGEQVASKAGRLWLSGVFVDLEKLAYAVAGADLCAAGIGSPHIRQRLFWVADANFASGDQWTRSGEQSVRDQNGQSGGMANGQGERWNRSANTAEAAGGTLAENLRAIDGMADAECNGGRTNQSRRKTQGRSVDGWIGGVEYTEVDRREQRRPESIGGGIAGGCRDGGMADAFSGRSQKGLSKSEQWEKGNTEIINDSCHRDNAWSRFQLISCLDGKTRRIESGTFPLAHGISGRVGLLRGYGNAIVPQLAAEFIAAFIETKQIGNSVPVELACAHAEAALK